MIRYTLRCTNEHDFESWFASASAFDTLLASGQVTCPVCNSEDVQKSLMAPALKSKDKVPKLTEPQSEIETAMRKMREHVEKNSEYVGMSFAKEARAIHSGDAPERAIHGEARSDEAKKLIEDGGPVAPLPFMPKAKTN